MTLRISGSTHSHFYELATWRNRDRTIDQGELDRRTIADKRELLTYQLPGDLAIIEIFAATNQIFEKYAYFKELAASDALPKPPFKVMANVEFHARSIGEQYGQDGGRTIGILCEGKYRPWEDFLHSLVVSGSREFDEEDCSPSPGVIDSTSGYKLINGDYTAKGVIIDKIPRAWRATSQTLLAHLRAKRDEGVLTIFLATHTIFSRIVTPISSQWFFEIVISHDPTNGWERSHSFVRLTCPSGHLYSFGLWRLDTPKIRQNQRPSVESPDRTEREISQQIIVGPCQIKHVEIFGGEIAEDIALRILSKILFDYRNEENMVCSLDQREGLSCTSWLLETLCEIGIPISFEKVTLTVQDVVDRYPIVRALRRLLDWISNWLKDVLPQRCDTILFCSNYYFARHEQLYRVSKPLERRAIKPLVDRPKDLIEDRAIICPHLLASALTELKNAQAHSTAEAMPWRISRYEKLARRGSIKRTLSHS